MSAAARNTKYRWVPCGPEKLYDVGILADGSLHNPNGYPDNLVRDAVMAANERRHNRRSDSAKKAAVTRQRRQDKRIYLTVAALKRGEQLKPSARCIVCRKPLDDPESISRGIGSECWQGVLAALERTVRADTARADQQHTGHRP
jgi:hypothetical protein